MSLPYKPDIYEGNGKFTNFLKSHPVASSIIGALLGAVAVKQGVDAYKTVKTVNELKKALGGKKKRKNRKN